MYKIYRKYKICVIQDTNDIQDIPFTTPPKGRNKPKRPLSSPDTPGERNKKKNKADLHADSSMENSLNSSSSSCNDEDAEKYISRMHRKIVGKSSFPISFKSSILKLYAEDAIISTFDLLMIFNVNCSINRY